MSGARSNKLSPDSGGKFAKLPSNGADILHSRRSSHGQGSATPRKPGVEWNRADEIDDGRDEALDVSDDEGSSLAPGRAAEPVEKRSPAGGQTIDLLDIAKPAKPKGIAKEFEVVQGSPMSRIVALPDEPRGPAPTEEEWENLGSEDVDSRKSYSAVLKD